ncbi:hypothetical protein BCR39DRAFT_530639 [Naematelia encephala]|uniref:Uncharacterized protein n=1 Tax=Naematelia encephala TaxID=71784 RepID=A0A1Y2B6C1_9TREE|nr:hypothetical protein BCR39DRAFT_530639 [Naematelia encephala]
MSPRGKTSDAEIRRGEIMLSTSQRRVVHPPPAAAPSSSPVQSLPIAPTRPRSTLHYPLHRAPQSINQDRHPYPYTQSMPLPYPQPTARPFLPSTPHLDPHSLPPPQRRSEGYSLPSLPQYPAGQGITGPLTYITRNYPESSERTGYHSPSSPPHHIEEESNQERNPYHQVKAPTPTPASPRGSNEDHHSVTPLGPAYRQGYGRRGTHFATGILTRPAGISSLPPARPESTRGFQPDYHRPVSVRRPPGLSFTPLSSTGSRDGGIARRTGETNTGRTSRDLEKQSTEGIDIRRTNSPGPEAYLIVRRYLARTDSSQTSQAVEEESDTETWRWNLRIIQSPRRGKSIAATEPRRVSPPTSNRHGTEGTGIDQAYIMCREYSHSRHIL